MEILITGGTGFIGTLLCRHLLENGHRLCVLTRRPERFGPATDDRFRAIRSLDELNPEERFDAIINLAGEGIADRRWTAKRKQALLDSRLDTTQGILDFIARADHRPRCLISGSAVGYYGDQGDTDVNENSTPRPDFGQQLCQRWEQLALQAERWNLRVCIVRIGLVVGPGGGFLQRLLLPFKMGLGGRLGSGTQWMSWVHLQDLVRLISWLLENESCQGPYNGTAPRPVTNREFTRILAGRLQRPAIFPVPAPLLKMALGEMSLLLLTGQKARPKRALEEGFEFQFDDLETALQAAL